MSLARGCATRPTLQHQDAGRGLLRVGFENDRSRAVYAVEGQVEGAQDRIAVL